MVAPVCPQNLSGQLGPLVLSWFDSLFNVNSWAPLTMGLTDSLQNAVGGATQDPMVLPVSQKRVLQSPRGHCGLGF